MSKGSPAAFSLLCHLRAHRLVALRDVRAHVTGLYAPRAKGAAALPVEKGVVALLGLGG